MSDGPSPEGWTDKAARGVLRDIFDAAVASADPGAAVLRHLPEKPRGRCVVVGAGKASVAMAAALDAAWGDVDLTGVVVTRHGQRAPAGRIEVLEASHPVPDAMSEEAGRRILAAVQGLTANDLVIALMSGGGSSLMVLPAGEMTLADKQAVNRSLLASGANIVEMNAVRKHLSGIKGGRLALAAHPARVVTLAISDIPGDDPAAIASGPTVADRSAAESTKSRMRGSICRPLRSPLFPPTETPKTLPAQNTVRVVVAPSLALAAAAQAAARLANATDSGRRNRRREPRARYCHGRHRPFEPNQRTSCQTARSPAVRRRDDRHDRQGRGRTRRTQHRIPARICHSHGRTSRRFCVRGRQRRNRRHRGRCRSDRHAGHADTRTRRQSQSARNYLVAHDSYSFFAGIGDLVRTGPTGTNVNDIRAVLITRGGRPAE